MNKFWKELFIELTMNGYVYFSLVVSAVKLDFSATYVLAVILLSRIQYA